MPQQISKREVCHGRDTTWSLRRMSAPQWAIEHWPGSATITSRAQPDHARRRPVDETRYCVTSLDSSAKALPRHKRQRCSSDNSWRSALDFGAASRGVV
jgi:hypothetical protein